MMHLVFFYLIQVTMLEPQFTLKGINLSKHTDKAWYQLEKISKKRQAAGSNKMLSGDRVSP